MAVSGRHARRLWATRVSHRNRLPARSAVAAGAGKPTSTEWSRAPSNSAQAINTGPCRRLRQLARCKALAGGHLRTSTSRFRPPSPGQSQSLGRRVGGLGWTTQVAAAAAGRSCHYEQVPVCGTQLRAGSKADGHTGAFTVWVNYGIWAWAGVVGKLLQQPVRGRFSSHPGYQAARAPSAPGARGWRLIWAGLLSSPQIASAMPRRRSSRSSSARLRRSSHPAGRRGRSVCLSSLGIQRSRGELRQAIPSLLDQKGCCWKSSVPVWLGAAPGPLWRFLGVFETADNGGASASKRSAHHRHIFRC